MESTEIQGQAAQLVPFRMWQRRRPLSECMFSVIHQWRHIVSALYTNILVCFREPLGHSQDTICWYTLPFRGLTLLAMHVTLGPHPKGQLVHAQPYSV